MQGYKVVPFSFFQFYKTRAQIFFILVLTNLMH